MEKGIFQNELNERLAKYPDKTAIEYGSTVLTYAELDGRSNCIANRLIDKGVKKETPIGILIEDRSDVISAVIGILKAGCVFVPLSSALPKSRLEKMIDSVDIDMIISDKFGFNYITTGEDDRGWKGQIVPIDDLLPVKESEWSTNCPGIHCTTEDKIYIYFTSGSTGKPRAIVGKSKSLLHFIHWEIDTFNIEAGFRISQLITPVFDAFLRDVFVPLFAGGSICIPHSMESIPAPGELVEWIDENGVHLIHCVPSLFRMFTTHATGDNFKSLKYILLSGESIKPADLVNWYRTFGDRVQLVNLYGSSETTMAKCFYLISESDVNRERIPVGKPIKGARIIVCDKNLKMCDELVTGEIYIRTPFRTHGYYNDSQLNSKRFIRNPYSNNPGDLLHKTGDLGRILPDGNIEFLGRIDRQVKIRGIGVELDEIEDVLAHHAAVKEAVVIKQEISTGGTMLIGYITGMESSENRVPGEESLTAGLKSYLSGILPVYMVPNEIIKIDTFPRTPNGKIDYELLSGLYTGKPKRYRPPVNRLEQRLVEVWAEILGLEETGKIGRDDNFFETGGNSLNGISLISKIHREFNVRVFLAQIFNNPTIEKQAKIIRESAADLFYEIPKTEKKEYYPLSSAQKRLYIIQQMNIDNQAYNMPMVIILEGNLDLGRLEKVFETLIQRHESLRTSFELKEGEPVQRVHREVDFEIERARARSRWGTPNDHRKVKESSHENKIYTNSAHPETGEIIDSFVRPFDLSHAPLLRVGLIKETDSRYVLMIDKHHIISDFISMNILVNDFISLYTGERLPWLKFQYKDYSQWQNGLEGSLEMKRQENHWLKTFSGEIPVLDLPIDYPRPPVQRFAGYTIADEIDKTLTGKIKATAVEHGVTPYVVLLAIFTVLISKYTGQDDIVVGSPVAGRTYPHLEKIVGMFVNVILMRNTVDSKKTFEEFLEDVKINTWQAFDNQDYPIERLMEKLEIKRDHSRNPLYEVIFALLDAEDREYTIPGLELKPLRYSDETIKTDLRQGVIEVNDKIIVTLTYSTALFKKKTVEDMLSNYVEIIEQVVTGKSIKLEDIKIKHDLVTSSSGVFEEDSSEFNF